MTATATTRARYLAAFLLVAAIGILLWQVTASSAKSPPKSKARGAVAEQSQSYSIFLRPPVAADASVAHWKAPGDPRIGARLAAGRVVHRDAVRTVAAVPTAQAPCLISRFADGSQGTSCGIDQPPTVVSPTGTIGLVPDSVDAVTITMTDGSTQIGRITGNVWKAPEDADKVAYSVDGHLYQLQLMPLSDLPAGAKMGPTGIVSGGAAPRGWSG